MWQVYGLDGELLAEYAANAAPTAPQKEYGYRHGELLVTATAGATTLPVNVASAAQGATASASSVYSSSYPADATINGDRKGVNWGAGGGWNDATASSYPDSLEVTFSGPKTISEVSVFTCQDSYANPSEPTQAMTFSLYGLTGYEVQYWTGSAWASVGSVSGNDHVWSKVSFAAVTTTKIKIVANAALASYSRLTEVEAYQAPTTTSVNVAAASSGATASASSVYPYGNYSAASAINGDRKGLNWGAGGGWNDATAGSLPDWLEVDFNGAKTISEVDLFTCQDNYANPSEPTETQTFTLYGLTGYEVQYWTGSVWANIPNGSVTGNDRVWRKFTFAAITTAKIRVLTNASISNDGYSRLTEVEAYEASQTAANDSVQWLISDHLGTPRMIADLSGSLAGIKRHDYLPFGEEVGDGVGGRTQAQGYSQVDNVRQHFTGKERDNETGMDYFGERYYSNSLGRFTTVDPLGASARTLNPQTFNRYTYVLNNPLRYIDPSGLKEEDPWNQLSKEEQRAIRTKLTIDKSHRTFRDAFNSLVTVQGDARATANNIGTIKNFIAAVGGQNGSNIWNQIQRIDRVDARSGDMSSVIGVTVKSRDEFKQALREEGYTDNAQWDKTGSGRLDSLRESTPYSTDPELHFESYPNSPTSFNAHWDPTSVNFDTVQRKFVAAGVGASVICDFNCGPVEAGRMLERAWSASQHGSPDHPTPGQVRDYQKRVGLAPQQ